MPELTIHRDAPDPWPLICMYCGGGGDHDTSMAEKHSRTGPGRQRHRPDARPGRRRPGVRCLRGFGGAVRPAAAARCVGHDNRSCRLELLGQLARVGTRPRTVVLDNARYQKCAAAEAGAIGYRVTVPAVGLAEPEPDQAAVDVHVGGGTAGEALPRTSRRSGRPSRAAWPKLGPTIGRCWPRSWARGSRRSANPQCWPLAV